MREAGQQKVNRGKSASFQSKWGSLSSGANFRGMKCKISGSISPPFFKGPGTGTRRKHMLVHIRFFNFARDVGDRARASHAMAEHR